MDDKHTKRLLTAAAIGAGMRFIGVNNMLVHAAAGATPALLEDLPYILPGLMIGMPLLPIREAAAGAAGGVLMGMYMKS